MLRARARTHTHTHTHTHIYQVLATLPIVCAWLCSTRVSGSKGPAPRAPQSCECVCAQGRIRILRIQPIPKLGQGQHNTGLDRELHALHAGPQKKNTLC